MAIRISRENNKLPQTKLNQTPPPKLPSTESREPQAKFQIQRDSLQQSNRIIQQPNPEFRTASKSDPRSIPGDKEAFVGNTPITTKKLPPSESIQTSPKNQLESRAKDPTPQFRNVNQPPSNTVEINEHANDFITPLTSRSDSRSPLRTRIQIESVNHAGQDAALEDTRSTSNVSPRFTSQSTPRPPYTTYEQFDTPQNGNERNIYTQTTVNPFDLETPSPANRMTRTPERKQVSFDPMIDEIGLNEGMLASSDQVIFDSPVASSTLEDLSTGGTRLDFDNNDRQHEHEAEAVSSLWTATYYTQQSDEPQTLDRSMTSEEYDMANKLQKIINEVYDLHKLNRMVEVKELNKSQPMTALTPEELKRQEDQKMEELLNYSKIFNIMVNDKSSREEHDSTAGSTNKSYNQNNSARR